MNSYHVTCWVATFMTKKVWPSFNEIELDTQLKGLHMKPHSNIQKGLDLRLLKYPVQLSRKLEYTGENEIPFKKRKHETWTKI